MVVLWTSVLRRTSGLRKSRMPALGILPITSVSEAAKLNPQNEFVTIVGCHTRSRLGNLKHYTHGMNESWHELEGQVFDYIRLAFLDGAVRDWTALVKCAAKHLKPSGVICVTDVEVCADYVRWLEAKDRMRAHTGRPLDALRQEGFRVEERGEELEIRDRNLFGAVLGRSKQLFDRALQFSPGSGNRAELIAKLGQTLNGEAQVQM